MRGKNPELSITTSQRRPTSCSRPLGLASGCSSLPSGPRSSSAGSSGSRLPYRCSTLISSGNSFSRRPRLKIVTWWPRATAAAMVFGPRKPVPPRIRMRFFATIGGGFGASGRGCEHDSGMAPSTAPARAPRRTSRRRRSRRGLDITGTLSLSTSRTIDDLQFECILTCVTFCRMRQWNCTMRWQPITDRPLRSRAGRAIRELAAILAEPAAAASPSLALGDAGTAVFFAYLARARFPVKHAVDRAQLYAGRAAQEVGDTALPFGLFGAIAGIAWMLDHLRGAELPRRDLCGELDASLRTAIRGGALEGEVDLVYGLCGIGVYALARRDGALAGRVVARLRASCVGHGDGVAW